MHHVNIGGHIDPRFADPAGPALTPTRVADLLETLLVASHRLAEQLTDLAATPAALTTGTIDRLILLADYLRPAVAARVALAAAPPQLLLDGAGIWLARGRQAEPPSAAVRARLRWDTRPTS